MPQSIRPAGGDVRFVRIFDKPECLVLVAGPTNTAGVKKPQIGIGSIQFERSSGRMDGFVEICLTVERR